MEVGSEQHFIFIDMFMYPTRGPGSHSALARKRGARNRALLPVWVQYGLSGLCWLSTGADGLASLLGLAGSAVLRIRFKRIS